MKSTLTILAVVLFLYLPVVYAYDEIPTAIINQNPTIAGMKVIFSGAGSYDNDCNTQSEIPMYLWDFDYDGSNFSPDYSSSSPVATFTFANYREYRVALIYVDDDGTSSQVSNITVNFSKHSEIYYLTDHLGNIRMSLNIEGEVVGYDDYYPFGQVMIGRSMNNGQPNATQKFTGKERDAETGYDNFGARLYDSKIARWLQVDPLSDKYPGLSPYNYCLNNPVNSFDPDGKLVIFVNGFNNGDGGTKAYWGIIADQIMHQTGDYHGMYVDGGAVGLSDCRQKYSANNRTVMGSHHGEAEAANIFAALENGESVKFVTHSMGAAYAKGFIRGMQKWAKENGKKFNIEFELDLAPFQPEEQSVVPDIKTYQRSHINDWVANTRRQNKLINGIKNWKYGPEGGHSVESFFNDIRKMDLGSKNNGSGSYDHETNMSRYKVD